MTSFKKDHGPSMINQRKHQGTRTHVELHQKKDHAVNLVGLKRC